MYLNIASISRCRMANHTFCLLKLVIYNKQYIYIHTHIQCIIIGLICASIRSSACKQSSFHKLRHSRLHCFHMLSLHPRPCAASLILATLPRSSCFEQPVSGRFWMSSCDHSMKNCLPNSAVTWSKKREHVPPQPEVKGYDAKCSPKLFWAQVAQHCGTDLKNIHQRGVASHSQLRIRTKLRFLSLSCHSFAFCGDSETCEQRVQMVKELLDSDVCWGRCIPMVRVFFGKSGAGFKTLQSSLHRGCRQSCARTTTTLRIHRYTKLH